MNAEPSPRLRNASWKLHTAGRIEPNSPGGVDQLGRALEPRRRCTGSRAPGPRAGGRRGTSRSRAPAAAARSASARRRGSAARYGVRDVAVERRRAAARLSASVTTIQRQPCELPPVGAWIARRRHSSITSGSTGRSRSRRLRTERVVVRTWSTDARSRRGDAFRVCDRVGLPCGAMLAASCRPPPPSRAADLLAGLHDALRALRIGPPVPPLLHDGARLPALRPALRAGARATGPARWRSTSS